MPLALRDLAFVLLLWCPAPFQATHPLALRVLEQIKRCVVSDVVFVCFVASMFSGLSMVLSRFIRPRCRTQGPPSRTLCVRMYCTKKIIQNLGQGPWLAARYVWVLHLRLTNIRLRYERAFSLCKIQEPKQTKPITVTPATCTCKTRQF